MAQLTKTEIARAVGALLGIEIVVSQGATVTRESWTNILNTLNELYEDANSYNGDLTKVETAREVGLLLGVKITSSTGSTITRESWENVLRALIELFKSNTN